MACRVKIGGKGLREILGIAPHRAALVLSVLCLAAGSLRAQTVTSNLDDGSAGTLRYVVTNNQPGPFQWSSGGAGTITLGSALDIYGLTTLNVSGAGSGVTIAGGPLDIGPTGYDGTVTLENTASTPFTISSTISGYTSLTVGGLGTVSLTGANTYSGGAILNGGTLNIVADSGLGASGTALTFNGGTLQAGASLTSSRPITLNNSGTFDTNGYTSVFTGLVSGTGELIIGGNGGGILDLQNTGNTYSGGTLLQSGTLSINSDSVLGTGGLSFDGGTLQTGASLTDSRSVVLQSLGGVFDTAGTTSTLAGLISGVGSLTKISSGTLVLSGANTYTGGTSVNGGVLAISNEGNLGAGNGTLSFNGGVLQTMAAVTDDRAVTLNALGGTIDTDGNNDSFNGAFSGIGSLTKIGAGSLTLGNSNNTYSGGTIVSAGALLAGVNNALPTNGALTVASGANFGLNGYSQTNALGNVVNNGVMSLGGGALNLGGTYSGSGTLAMTLKPGLTNVTGGNITATGGTLSLLLDDPAATNGKQYTAINAASLSGTFNVISPAAVNFTPIYSANSLTLTAALVPFANLGSTPNQSAVGAALESLRVQAQSNPTGAAGGVIGALYGMNLSQIQSAFDQIGPIALAPMTSLGLSASSVQAEALGRRMTALDEGAPTGGFSAGSMSGLSPLPGALTAEAGVSDADPFAVRLEPATSPDSPFGFFATGVGTSGHLQSMSGPAGSQPGYDYLSGGLVLGGDYRVDERLAVGLSGGYLHGQSNIYTTQSSWVTDDSARAGVYATGHDGPWRADAYVGGALDFFNTSRGILLSGGQAMAADGSPTGREFNSNVDGSYDIPTQNWGVLAPFVGLNDDRLTINSFGESGAGALDLNVGRQSDQSLRSTLGLRQTYKTVADGIGYQSHWSLGWIHEYMSQSRAIDAQLESGAGSAFSVQTADLPRDGALAGVGTVISVDQSTSVNLDYSADVRPGFMESVLNATLRVLF